MLAGLLFATAEATDRRDSLAATLPIAGVTLIEFQARLLVAAGASQIVVVVSRLTPELLGAVNRIGRRGITIDAVRSPAEALAKLHPLARVVWLADGLVTSGNMIEMLGDRERDTVLVTNEGDELERVGPDAVWAGAALIDAQRIAEVGKLPADYDFASSLLRVTVQQGAELLPLTDAMIREGHGIRRDSATLAGMGKAAMVSALAARRNWLDRFVVAPLARLALPPLIERGVPAAALGGIGAAFGLAGLIAEVAHYGALGLVGVILALLLFTFADVVAWLRDERRLSLILRGAIMGGAAASVLLLGVAKGAMEGSATAPLLALGTVVAGALGERAATIARRRLWWAVPACYPVLLFPAALLGHGTTGLGIVAAYAIATLTAAIEQLRSGMRE